ncbi:hypothetical protein N779_10040 [Vibrio coralliilyticus OCN008]|nr:hypothetical protein N779_10040 [Vibrio coralliilyticus OCN008]
MLLILKQHEYGRAYYNGIKQIWLNLGNKKGAKSPFSDKLLYAVAN